MSLTFYKFGEAFGLPDPSPFCVKLESFLRLNHIDFRLGDFDIKTTLNKAPKKKMPFVVFENGEAMGDSTLIIDRLSRERNIDMEEGLSAQQKAQSHAMRRMLDESTYFCGLYARWIDDAGWAVIKPMFFGDVGLPKFLANIISKKIRSDVIKSAKGQGIARHTTEEVYDHAISDYQALSDLLGKDQWFFGADKPGLLDIWAHAYVVEMIDPPIETSMKKRLLEMDNLVQHARRFHGLVYGDTAGQTHNLKDVA